MGLEPWIIYTIAGFCGLVVLASSIIGFKIWRSKQKPDPAKQALNRFLAGDDAIESKSSLDGKNSPSTAGYGSDAERRHLVHDRRQRKPRDDHPSEDLRQPRPAYMHGQQRSYSPAWSQGSDGSSPPLVAYPQHAQGTYPAGKRSHDYYPRMQDPPPVGQLRGEYWA